jgi:hypothetical protein
VQKCQIYKKIATIALKQNKKVKKGAIKKQLKKETPILYIWIINIKRFGITI